MSVQPKCAHGTCSTAPAKSVANPESSTMDTFLRVVELVTLVGLAAFAAYTNPKLFIPFAAAGFLLGMYLEFEQKGCESCKSQACTQSFFQQLTKLELPPLFSIAANAGMTYAHIVDHHCCHITCPIAGFYAGAFVGAMVVRYGTKAINALREWNTPTTTTQQLGHAY